MYKNTPKQQRIRLERIDNTIQNINEVAAELNRRAQKTNEHLTYVIMSTVHQVRYIETEWANLSTTARSRFMTLVNNRNETSISTTQMRDHLLAIRSFADRVILSFPELSDDTMTDKEKETSVLNKIRALNTAQRTQFVAAMQTLINDISAEYN